MKNSRSRKLQTASAAGIAIALCWSGTTTAQTSTVDIPPESNVSNTQTSAVSDSSTGIVGLGSSGSATTPNGLQERTTLLYAGAPLIDVLKMLCKESKINHVFSPGAQSLAEAAKVHLELTDITYEIALKTVLDLYGLGTVLEDGIAKIDRIENIKRNQQDKEQLRTEMIKAEPPKTVIYQLNYTKAGDISALITGVMKSYAAKDPRFSVLPDDKSNRIIIEAALSAHSRIKTLIDKLDRRKQMVSIETRIIEASNEVSRFLKVNWGGRFGLDAGRGLSSGIIFPNSILGSIGGAGEVAPLGVGRTSPLPGAIGVSIGTINGMFNLDAILRAYENENLANIVANPTQTVMDNETADFSESINTQVPLAAAVGQAATQYANFVSTLKVGVTPLIANDNSMELTVDVQRDTPTSTPISGANSKISRTAKTKLAVRSGETAVIGGLYQTTKTRDQGRIPFLGKIPILGALFRTNDSYTKRTELIILITPRIVNNASGGATAAATDFSTPLGGQQPLQPLPVSSEGNTLSNNGLNSAGSEFDEERTAINTPAMAQDPVITNTKSASLNAAPVNNAHAPRNNFSAPTNNFAAPPNNVAPRNNMAASTNNAAFPKNNTTGSSPSGNGASSNNLNGLNSLN